MKTFTIKTLGCKVNQYESQAMREIFEKNGYVLSDDKSADIVVINSCTVTGTADAKTRKIIKKIRKDNPSAEIVLSGCLAVIEEDIAKFRKMPEIVRVVPNDRKFDFCDLVGTGSASGDTSQYHFQKISRFDSHTRAFCQIQTGCDQACTYCKVHLVRGRSESRSSLDITNEVNKLIGAGYREIVITGICVGSWKGESDLSLAGLLKLIASSTTDSRIRLSSIEPNHVTEELIEVISSGGERICQHLHIPLQSGCDKTLRSMNRRYTSGEYENLISRIRLKTPHVGITTDVICGFPGESDESYKKTVETIQRIKPSRLHVFKYSDREGTPSFEMTPKVPSRIAEERVSKLIEIGKQLECDFAAQFSGNQVKILVESEIKDGLCSGYTSQYAEVLLEGFQDQIGRFVDIRPIMRSNKLYACR
ncbi:MAG: tRNA (N(6)-L-threonylcarbamoyladenosine(37)-C(2))-methylthiotransferase MtaB [Candidatus Omnitrophica bacterium]|nr:tRNA (N(6)-L-threonylcarbamoyladenosine(37)-C(2))-methylthiotransferase MtaB [Candidatus Omnitrophota bacterium]